MEDQKTLQERQIEAVKNNPKLFGAYRVCPINGTRMAVTVCLAKVQKGICLQDGDECHTVGKRRDHSQEKFIKTFSGGKEDKVMTKVMKKASRTAKKQSEDSAAQASKEIIDKASQAATVDKPAVPFKTPEQRIVEERISAGNEATLELKEIETQIIKGGKVMKTKKAAKKVLKAVKKAEAKKTQKASSQAAEKDAFGFRKGSKSSEAIKMLASGKATLKDARKEFNTLSFGILLDQLTKNGFKVKEDADGLCTLA